MSQLQFRDATVDDIAVMLALSHAGDVRGSEAPPLEPTSLQDPRYRSAFEEIAADPNQRLIVGEIDGEVIGTLQISIIPGLPNFGAKRGMLENVHIRVDQRGTGYGTAMLRWAIDLCREAGCTRIQLTSNKKRVDAHRFYAALGFEATHEGFKLGL